MRRSGGDPGQQDQADGQRQRGQQQRFVQAGSKSAREAGLRRIDRRRRGRLTANLDQPQRARLPRVATGRSV